MLIYKALPYSLLFELLCFVVCTIRQSNCYKILDNGAVLSTVINPTVTIAKIDPLEYQETDVLNHPGVEMFRNALTDSYSLWPGAIVPYEVDNSVGSKTVKAIKEAIFEFDQYSCIRWVQRTTETQWVLFTSGSGCYSYIGRQPQGPQQVSIGHNCDYKGTLLHEMMHVLGFFHEHNRRDRNDFVEIKWNSISPGKEFNFNKNDGLSYTSGDTLSNRYDYGSIMHYGPRFFSVDGIRPTIVPKDHGVTIGQRRGLSDYDIEKLNTLYQCSKKSELKSLQSVQEQEEAAEANIQTQERSQSSTSSAASGQINNKNSELSRIVDRVKATNSRTHVVPSPWPISKSIRFPSCEDTNFLCKWWAVGDGCTVYPGLRLTCRASCKNCEGNKCSDTSLPYYKSLCKSIQGPHDSRCGTDAFKSLCPKTCNYCIT